MDKAEFVQEAPVYYALAIATELSRSGEKISKSEIMKKFGHQSDGYDADTYINLLNNDSLWEMGIEWLRQRGMVEVKTLSFGPPLYARGEKFSKEWHDLVSRSDAVSVFRTYGVISDADDWLTESLLDIYRESGRLNLVPQDFARFSNIRPKLLDRWDVPEHRPVSDLPQISENLTDEDATQAIQGWFFANFEDPVHSTPYNSQEGGYLFIHGGPYDAREIIEAVFSHVASDDVINEAIEQIEHESDLWVPSRTRRIPPDDDFDDPPIEYLHSRMRKQVEGLEELLKEEPQSTPGIGHNRPPEEVDLSPFKDEDKEQLSEALEVLKNEPPRPETSAAAQAAIATIKSKAKKLSEWTGGQAKIFAEEAIKEAGKQVGKWTPPVFWAVVLEHVLGVAQHAEAWIKALMALAGH